MASHTTKVFENNYQTEHVRTDLASKRFGACAGGTSSEPLFKVMRDLSKQNDPGAPLEATPEQKASIKSRRDIMEREAAVRKAQAGGDKGEIRKAKAALDRRRRALHDLLLIQGREEYFEEANKLRAEGKSTDKLRQRSRPSRPRRDHDVLDVGGLMTLWTGEPGFGNRTGTFEELVFDHKAEGRSEGSMEWLLHYVAGNWTLLTRPLPVSSTAATTPKSKTPRAKTVKETTEAKPDRLTCLLCDTHRSREVTPFLDTTLSAISNKAPSTSHSRVQSAFASMPLPS